MKKQILLYIFLLFPIALLAQTQQGYVKTKGRMINGKHVAGKGLPGASVSIQGGNSVTVKNSNGSFLFVVPAKNYIVQSVHKKGYELVDADVTKKLYHHSSNPLYLVMETPDQQMEDQLEAEEKISRTLREQLKKARQEIQRLKDENIISEEEFRQQITKLMEEQRNNKEMIAEMAKEYAKMDYDQMDDLNRRISNAILNGRLTEADSLLRSKGDINSRIAKNKQKQEAEAREAEELATRQQNLEQSQTGTQKEKEDIAADCYKFFNRFKLDNQHDSAAYYIQLRAELDTTDAEWQHTAAYYLQNQKQFQKADSYYLRTLTLLRNTEPTDSIIYNHNLALALINYANLQFSYQHFQVAESLYNEALERIRHLSQLDSLTYDLFVVGAQNNLASLYAHTGRPQKSEALYKEVLETSRRLAITDSLTYKPYIAFILNNLGTIYIDTSRFEEGRSVLMEALEIYELFEVPESEQERLDRGKADTLHNLAIISDYMKEYWGSETFFKEALKIRQQLAEKNPQAYESDVAQTMNYLAILYHNSGDDDESELMYVGALKIRRRLWRDASNVYLQSYAETLLNLYRFYNDRLRFNACDSLYHEALDVYRYMTKQDSQSYNIHIASVLESQSFFANLFAKYTDAERVAREVLAISPSQHWITSNLAASLLFQGKYSEAEAIYRQYKEEQKNRYLRDLQLFSDADAIPKNRLEDVERIIKMLNE